MNTQSLMYGREGERDRKGPKVFPFPLTPASRGGLSPVVCVSERERESREVGSAVPTHAATQAGQVNSLLLLSSGCHDDIESEGARRKKEEGRRTRMKTAPILATAHPDPGTYPVSSFLHFNTWSKLHSTLYPQREPAKGNERCLWDEQKGLGLDSQLAGST